jgi:hypothetical protein
VNLHPSRDVRSRPNRALQAQAGDVERTGRNGLSHRIVRNPECESFAGGIRELGEHDLAHLATRDALFLRAQHQDEIPSPPPEPKTIAAPGRTSGERSTRPEIAADVRPFTLQSSATAYSHDGD